MPLRHVLNPARPLTYGIVQAGPNVPDGVPYIRPADMTPTAGVRDEAELLRTSPEIAATYERASLRAGDVILSIGPSFGKVMIVPQSLEGSNLTQGTARLAPGPDVDARWLYWILQAKPAQSFWEAAAAGGTFRALNLGPLGETPLSVPVHFEQRRIADFLDARVARIDQIIAAREYTARGYQQQFESLRRDAVVGQRSARLITTDLLWAPQVPDYWPIRRLLQVARMGTGHTPSRSKSEYWDDCQIPWLTTSDVHKFRHDEIDVIYSTEIQISHLGLANSAAVLHPSETVALSRTASAGFPILMGQDMATSQDFVTWTCGKALLPRYLLQVLRVMRPYLLGYLAMGSTHKTIYFPDLMDLRVPVPPASEQAHAVSKVAKAAERRNGTVEAIRLQVRALSEYKQSLVTAAVTGEFDVTTASTRVPGE